MTAKFFLVPFVLLMAASPAIAELYISPVVRDTVNYDHDARGGALTGRSSVHGDFEMSEGRARGDNPMRYGANVPLFVAMDNIIPGGQSWHVNLDDGLENQVVSWEGGNSWEGVLTAIADQNELSIVMNHREQAIGVARTESLARHLAKKSPEVWRLSPGHTLKGNLEAWADQAGWQLSWDENLRIDYPILHRATLTGSFYGEGGVVDRLLATFRGQPRPLTADFYTQNRVVRITEAGYRRENDQ